MMETQLETILTGLVAILLGVALMIAVWSF